MRRSLPDRLGSEFWFALVMIAFGLAGALFGLVSESGTKIAMGVLIALLFAARLVQHVRDVRLARWLKNNPKMSRIYNAQNR